jgi:hypothetical protein
VLATANVTTQLELMALGPRLRAAVSSEPDPVVTDLPRLADDPDVQRLTQRKAELRRARDARQALLEVRAIDRELRGVTMSQKGPRADLLRERRLKLLELLPAPAVAQPVAVEVGLHASVVAALRLLSGEKRPEPEDSAAETVRLTDELRVFETAMRQLDYELDEIREARSADVARRLWDQHREILLSKWKAAVALVQATATERQLIAQMISRGYSPMPGILLSPRLAAADALGDMSRPDSPIGLYQSALQLAGVL